MSLLENASLGDSSLGLFGSESSNPLMSEGDQTLTNDAIGSDGLLFAQETLDGRSSPDLWPERIPGVTEFVAQNSPLRSSPRINLQSSSRQPVSRLLPVDDDDEDSPSTVKEWNRDLDQEDMTILQGFGSLTTPALLEKVRELQDLAYQLGLEESREMTRGKFLDVLSKSDRLDIYTSLSTTRSSEANGGGMTPLSSPITSIRRDLR